LQVLERDGLVSTRTVRRAGPGRPSAHYELTGRARRLFPDNSADLANELMGFLEGEHGRSELLRFLRWRAERHEARYAERIGDAGTVAERAERLALLLSDDGFDSRVETVTVPDGATELQLTQGHCALESVATEHPELCAFEASLFRRLLGARLSRRETIAGGAGACVCHISDPPSEKTDPSKAGAIPHGDQS
ncbi:MAG: helix-turn-helix transcriptional regulator, partial [Egibacteraceae bacterium]